MRLLRTAALLVSLASLAAARPAAAEEAELPPGVTARVFGEDITEAQLMDRLARRYETGEKGREILDQIIDDTAVAEEARARNVAVTEPEIDAYVAKVAATIRQMRGGTRTLEDELAETQSSMAEFRRSAREYLLRQKMAVQDLGGKPDEDLAVHRIKLWVSSVKRRLGVKTTGLPDGVLAQVGGVSIDRARFAQELRTRLSKEQVAGVRAELVLDAATRHAVQRAGVSVTDADVDAQIARLRARFESNPRVAGSGVTFDAFLRQTFGIGEADLRKDPTFRARVGLERMVSKGIDDAAIRKHWDENRASYGERALVRQVYVAASDEAHFQGKGRLPSFREAQDLALRAKVEILEKAGLLAGDGKAKTPLTDLVTAVAKQFELDPERRAQAGEPQVWTRLNVEGQPSLEQGAFDGPVGTLQGPVRGTTGFHVFVVEERRPAPTFDECRESVRDDLVRLAVRRFQMELRADGQIQLAKEK
ncbi:MAG: Chaperone SurA [Planctomycetes bacterium]|nr:Chaperone SurA [Planctomycetota bacterium]